MLIHFSRVPRQSVQRFGFTTQNGKLLVIFFLKATLWALSSKLRPPINMSMLVSQNSCLLATLTLQKEMAEAREITLQKKMFTIFCPQRNFTNSLGDFCACLRLTEYAIPHHPDWAFCRILQIFLIGMTLRLHGKVGLCTTYSRKTKIAWRLRFIHGTMPIV